MCNARFHRSKQGRAYTLIEVLVLVVIMGIAGALVMPSFSSMGVLRVHAAVRSVVADITFAQSDALAYQKGRAIVFDVPNNQYTLVEIVGDQIDPVNNAIYDPHGPGQRYQVSLNGRKFGDSIIESVDFNGGTTLIFDALGGPVAAAGSDQISDGGSIVISGMGTRFRVNVAAFTGRVTAEKID